MGFSYIKDIIQWKMKNYYSKTSIYILLCYYFLYIIYIVTTSWTHTVCPRGSDPFNIVTYCIKWVTTSWTHSSIRWIGLPSYLSTMTWVSLFISSYFCVDGGLGGICPQKIGMLPRPPPWLRFCFWIWDLTFWETISGSKSWMSIIMFSSS